MDKPQVTTIQRLRNLIERLNNMHVKTVEPKLIKYIEPTSEELETLEKEIFKQTNDNSDNKQVILIPENATKYCYPEEKPFIKINSKYEPIGTQWIHDNQHDDVWTDREERLDKQFKKLRAIILPEQRSKEWFEMRNNKIK